jgi:hypothetical protein
MASIDIGDIVLSTWDVNPQTWRVRQNGVPSYVEIEAARDASVDELHAKAKVALARRDIVELLWREARSDIDAGVGDGWPHNEAADEITRLRRLLDEAVAANAGLGRWIAGRHRQMLAVAEQIEQFADEVERQAGQAPT